MPITWRNIQAPDFRGSAAILEQGGARLDKALSGAARIAQDGVAREDEAVALSSADFLNRLRGEYASPEALQQAQASGAIDQLRGRYAQLDPGKTDVAAVDGVVGDLRRSAIEQSTYDTNRRAEATRPIADEIYSDVAAGRFDEATARVTNNELEGEKALLAFIDQKRRQVATDERSAIEEGRADTRYAQSQTTYRQGQEAFERGEQDRLNTERASAASDDLLERTLKQKENLGQQINWTLERYAPRGVTQEMFGMSTEEISRLPTATREALTEAQEEVGALYEEFAPNSSELGQGLTRSLLGEDLPGELAIGSATQFGNQLYRANRISPEAQKRLDDALAETANEPRFKSSALINAYRNPSVPIEEFNKLTESDAYKKLRDQTSPLIQGRLARNLQSLMINGVEVDGEMIPLPAPFIEQVLKSSNRAFILDDDPVTVARSLAESDLFLKEMRAFRDFKQVERARKVEFSNPSDVARNLASFVGGADVAGATALQVERDNRILDRLEKEGARQVSEARAKRDLRREELERAEFRRSLMGSPN